MKWWATSLLWLLLWTQAANSQPQIRVAAASDLRQAMPELIRVFQAQHPQIRVQAVYGPSGRFYGQIQNGAPFDVFMSADMRYPRQLAATDAQHGDVIPYARGTLALWHTNSTPPSLQHLLQARRIVIANPQHAPYGQLAQVWLAQLAESDQLLPHLVFAESAAQVAHMVRSGGADIGVSALSVLRSPQLQAHGSYTSVATATGYTAIEQGMMLTARGLNNAAAETFVQFIQQDGLAILQEHGFLPPINRMQVAP